MVKNKGLILSHECLQTPVHSLSSLSMYCIGSHLLLDWVIKFCRLILKKVCELGMRFLSCPKCPPSLLEGQILEPQCTVLTAEKILKRLDRRLSGSGRQLRVKLRPGRDGRRLSSSPDVVAAECSVDCDLERVRYSTCRVPFTYPWGASKIRPTADMARHVSS
ncbi:Uncharacterized protein Fot_05264 [Forsythia ovata]|uniref:Uncharacterized protein n=1 Tax=Forsythia ovata TaxID=205694 RepID=A0ABD1WTL4_9LAMI